MSRELSIRNYDPQLYIQTNLGNKISKRCHIHGSQTIVLAGNTILMSGSIIRGDLCSVHTGNFCFVAERVVIRPAFKHFKGNNINYFPIRLGTRVVVEEDSVVNAAEIGNYVYIGKNVIIGQTSVIKDCCYIMDNSVLQPDTVIPPFSIVSGNPAKVVGQMPVNTIQLMTEITSDLYYKFQPKAATDN